MIPLFNPRSTTPARRRFPHSLLALAACLPDEETAIVDGNVDPDPAGTMAALARRGEVEAFAFSVMPGPQLPEAVRVAKRLRAELPAIPIVWGGYFPSLYPDPCLAAPYVDYVVRGQGERTIVELSGALRAGAGPDRLAAIAGLSWKREGRVVANPERIWEGPDAFPEPPFHRVRGEDYISPTWLGRRTTTCVTSIGCPYTCRFCGVISVFGSREKFESVDRTFRVLSGLRERHGIDSVFFIDNNFFLQEAHTRELADRIAPLGLAWWCEARVDVALRYSDATWRAIRDSGCRMIFFGVESGSDEVLARMEKGIEARQTLELVARLRPLGIVPELSFVLGAPPEPERDIETTLAFIREIEARNPSVEIVLYFYHPTPQRDGGLLGGEGEFRFPGDLETWCRPEWLDFQTHTSERLPWIPGALLRRVRGFDEVRRARFPSVHRPMRPWGGALLSRLADWRWRREVYGWPLELALVRKLAGAPRDRQAYGHFLGTRSGDEAA